VESALSNDAAFVALHEEALSENGSAGHLSTEQTADYVDRHLSGEALQFVNDHLTGCEHCALAVADLRAFRNEIAPSLDREYGPTTAPAVVKTRWREKFVSLFRVAPVPAFGGAALAMRCDRMDHLALAEGIESRSGRCAGSGFATNSVS
jgi:anti-sigma factor RsiW